MNLTLDYVNERKAFGQDYCRVPEYAVQARRYAHRNLDVAQAFIDQCVLEHNEGKLSADDAAKAKLFCERARGAR